MDDIDDKTLTTLILCSFRYALDRKTGISYEMSDIILRYKDRIYSFAKDQIKRDIRHKMHTDGFEEVRDLETWQYLMENL